MMGELSRIKKILDALDLSVSARVGCELTVFDVIELVGHIDSLDGMIAEMKERIAELEQALRWIPVGSGENPKDGDLLELIDVHTKQVVSWIYSKRIDMNIHIKSFTHWRHIQLPDGSK